MTLHRRPKNVVCILGMHRSGTSALTGSLQNSGLILGKFHSWNRHNQKGNRENQDIVDLHDEILKHCNGSWDNPPKKVVWTQKQSQKAEAILAEHDGEDFWGFKDPRSLLTLNGWEKLIPDIRKVGIVRHPASVARSLHTRGKIPLNEGLGLWYRYNKCLLKQLKKSKFPLLCFDWGEDEFHEKLNRITAEMGLESISRDRRFYTQELHHHINNEDTQLPWKIRRLYKQLIKHTYN